MTGKPPWWFLDVDGVVASWDQPKKAKHGKYERVAVTALDGVTYPIDYSLAVVDRINAMHRAGLVEVVWLTTWNRSARECLAPAIGLDDFAVLEDPADPALSDKPYERTRLWWKTHLVMQAAAAEPDRPLIWTDDLLDRATKNLLRDVLRAPSKLLTTMRTPGLTQMNLDVVEDFARAHITERTTP